RRTARGGRRCGIGADARGCGPHQPGPRGRSADLAGCRGGAAAIENDRRAVEAARCESARERRGGSESRRESRQGKPGESGARSSRTRQGTTEARPGESQEGRGSREGAGQERRGDRATRRHRIEAPGRDRQEAAEGDRRSSGQGQRSRGPLSGSIERAEGGLFRHSRSRAQNGANDGALTGATALVRNSCTDRSGTGPAVQSAVNTALTNQVAGGAESVTPADVTFPTTHPVIRRAWRCRCFAPPIATTRYRR